MRWSIILLVFLSLSFALADNRSSTRSDFNIAGCANGLPVGTCSSDGYIYCGTDLIQYNTMNIGCTMGKSNFITGIDPQCCPENNICSGGACVPVGCSAYTNQPDCE
ncbi:MAG: hypothetical protein Q8N88_01890, partial [Nanoarchaeota archaeon]|nr:hypothetical protein [Nanoarchaeota archaeon]